MREVKTKTGASVREWKPPTTQEKAAQNLHPRCAQKPTPDVLEKEGNRMREVKTKTGASVREWKPPTTQEKAAQNVCRSKKPDKSLRNREGRVALREMVMPELGLVPRDIPLAEDGDVLCESRIRHLCDFLSSGGVLQRWLDARVEAADNPRESRAECLPLQETG